MEAVVAGLGLGPGLEFVLFEVVVELVTTTVREALLQLHY